MNNSTSNAEEAGKQLREKLASTLSKLKKEGASDDGGLIPTEENTSKSHHSAAKSSARDQDESNSNTNNNNNNNKRRSRRPYTAAEDEALLQGYCMHGFQWTSIQQDARLNLGHRKATHLRDRFRTKFPQVYRDGGTVCEDVRPASGGRTAVAVPTTDHAWKLKSPLTEIAGPNKGGNHKDGAESRHSHPQQQPLHQSNSNSGSSIPSLSQSQSQNPGAVDAMVWEDNTLPPLVWDELS